MAENRILGPDGKPLGKPLSDVPIPEAIQALIRVQILEGVDSLRQSNRVQFEEIKIEVAKKYNKPITFLALLTAFFGLMSWRFWSSVPAAVQQQLIEPRVSETVTQVISTKSNDFISKRLQPLEERAKAADSKMDHMAQDISGTIERINSVSAQIKPLEARVRAADLEAKDMANKVTTLQRSLDGTSMIAAEVRHKLDGLNVIVAETTTELRTLQAGTRSANEELARVSERMKLQPVLLAAQADSRQAFNQLKSWADDPSCSFQAEAKNAWWFIVDSYDAQLRFDPGDVEWHPLFDPAKLSLLGLRKNLDAAEAPQLRMRLVKYIWNREDFSKDDRMHFLADLLVHERSLKTLGYAVGLFDTEAKINKKHLLVSYYLDWWELHKHEYPLSLPILGIKSGVPKLGGSLLPENSAAPPPSLLSGDALLPEPLLRFHIPLPPPTEGPPKLPPIVLPAQR